MSRYHTVVVVIIIIIIIFNLYSTTLEKFTRQVCLFIWCFRQYISNFLIISVLLLSREHTTFRLPASLLMIVSFLRLCPTVITGSQPTCRRMMKRSPVFTLSSQSQDRSQGQISLQNICQYWKVILEWQCIRSLMLQ